MGVLDSYHAALGELFGAAEGTLVRLTADELMVVFNDPLPCEEPAARAVRLAVALRDRVWELAEGWNRLGFDLQLAAGLALGHATIGRIGFERRWEYAPVGTVPTLAERLCESAGAGQILIGQRVFAATEGVAITQPVGELALRGFSKPARAYDVLGLEALSRRRRSRRRRTAAAAAVDRRRAPPPKPKTPAAAAAAGVGAVAAASCGGGRAARGRRPRAAARAQPAQVGLGPVVAVEAGVGVGGEERIGRSCSSTSAIVSTSSSSIETSSVESGLWCR